MIGRIIEVAEDKRYLSMHRGFLVIQESGDECAVLGRVPLDDVGALIANAHGITLTNNLLVALGERGAPFVSCGPNHNVVGMLWPIDGNHQQAKRFDAQLAASLPTRKRLWADIVRQKLRQQAAVLNSVGVNSTPLTALVSRVRSGDTGNVEAQGARRYWSILFGKGFRRDRAAGGLNGMLNYGYTVLRATTARAVVAAGLHPTPAIHHGNESNPMRLVDDLMEPFRPLIDHTVHQLHQSGVEVLDKDSKRILVHALYQDMTTDRGLTPASVCIQRLAVSLAQVYLGERDGLEFPTPCITASGPC